MDENGRTEDLQDAVERSYRAQWGGRRFCLVTAIVLFALAVAAGCVLVVAHRWFGLTEGVLKLVEVSALAAGFVCLTVGVLSALEALVRWQREKDQVPNRIIHLALCLSVVTLAGLVFLVFVSSLSLGDRGIGSDLAAVIRFVLFLFCALVWLASVVMSSAGITLLVSRRSDLLAVNSTTEGTALLFRKGHTAEIVKLCVAALIPLILFVVGFLMASMYLL